VSLLWLEARLVFHDKQVLNFCTDCNRLCVTASLKGDLSGKGNGLRQFRNLPIFEDAGNTSTIERTGIALYETQMQFCRR